MPISIQLIIIVITIITILSLLVISSALFVLLIKMRKKQENLVSLIIKQLPKFNNIVRSEQMLSDHFELVISNAIGFDEFSQEIEATVVLPEVKKENASFNDLSNTVKNFFENKAVKSVITGTDAIIMANASMPFLETVPSLVQSINEAANALLPQHLERISFISSNLMEELGSQSAENLKNQMGMLLKGFGEELVKSPENMPNILPIGAYLAKDTLENLGNLYKFLLKGKALSFNFDDTLDAIITPEMGTAAIKSIGHSLSNVPIVHDTIQTGEQFQEIAKEYFSELGKAITNEITSSAESVLQVETIPDKFAEFFPDHEVVNNLSENVSSGLVDQAGVNPGLDFHIPWITLITSSAREIAILADGNKNLDEALGHILLDATGTGIGGWGGMQLGASVGTVFGPVGTIAGGFLGGILGALAGRSLTDSIKYDDLNQAKMEYEDQIAAMKNDEKEILDEISSGFSKLHTEKAQALNTLIVNKPVKPDLDSEFIQKVMLLKTMMDKDLILARQLFNQNIDIILSEIPENDKTTTLFGAIVRNHSIDAKKIAQDRYEESLKNIYVGQLPSEIKIKSAPRESLQILQNIPHLADGYFEKSYTSSIVEVKQINTNILAAYLLWATLVLSKHKESIYELSTYIDSEVRQFKHSVDDHKKNIHRKELKLREEAAKVGQKL